MNSIYDAALPLLAGLFMASCDIYSLGIITYMFLFYMPASQMIKNPSILSPG